MKIGNRECGAPLEALRARFGGYGSMIQRVIGPNRDIEVFDIRSGVLPSGTPGCDAFILTGSAAGVYDDVPWIPELVRFLQQVRGRAKLVGIRFGHQAMAEASGAVIKSPKGWGFGLQRYDVRHRAHWMDGAASVHAPASHQDQVVACPPGARVTAANAFTPYAGLDYGDAISFQFHPEFEAEFATALIEARRDRYRALADPAIASYGQPHDCARVSQWIRSFLWERRSRR